MGGKTGGVIANVFGHGDAWAAREAGKASDRGADAQIAATQSAIDLEWYMYNQSREDFAPWREAGERALASAEEQINAGPGEFKPEEQPGYEFGYKNFVEKPYLSAQAAKGKRLSGETMKGLIGYAQDYASTSYDNFLNRYYQRLNPLLSLAGAGQTAATSSANAAMATGQSVGGLQQNIGQIQSQNALNQAALQAQSFNSFSPYTIGGKVGGIAGNAIGGLMK